MPSPFFFLPFLGRAALVVRLRFGSSACCPGGRLLASMISSIVFFTDASCLSFFFAFALALPFAFGLAVPKAPPCGPPDGGSISGTVAFCTDTSPFLYRRLRCLFDGLLQPPFNRLGSRRLRRLFYGLLQPPPDWLTSRRLRRIVSDLPDSSLEPSPWLLNGRCTRNRRLVQHASLEALLCFIHGYWFRNGRLLCDL